MQLRTAGGHYLTRLWPWLIVLLVLVFVGFIRLRLLQMPLERDEGEYAYSGQLLLHGIPPYDLACNMKLPGTYFMAALGMALFGQTIAGLHLTLLIANWLTIVFIFLLGRKLFDVTAGLVACASYAVMSVSPLVLGLQAHANHFVVLFAVPATLLLLKADEQKKLPALFGSGLLYGLAFLMKQQGVVFCFFGWLVLFGRGIRDKNIFSAGFRIQCFAFGIGMVLPVAMTFLALAIYGVFSKFWFWIFTYAHIYATTTSLPVGFRIMLRHLLQTCDVSWALWLLAISGLPLVFLNKARRVPAFFVVIFWFCSFLGAAIGMYFRPHYFILLLPAFALLIGLAVSQWQMLLRFRMLPNVFKSLPLIFFALILSWTVFYHSRIYFQSSPSKACAGIYIWEPFVEAVAAGDYIRNHSSPKDRVAVMGSEPEIYFYAQRHSVTGYLFMDQLMRPQSIASVMQREMIQEIETNHPEFLLKVSYVSSWAMHTNSDFTILRWSDQYAAEHYHLVGFIHRGPAGHVESVWGDDAEANFKSVGQSIAIYRRKV